MRRFSYYEQDEYGNDVLVTVNERYIFINYYDDWCKKTECRLLEGMFKKLSKESKWLMCLTEFVNVNWAKEI